MAGSTLFTFPESFRAYKIQIAAKYSGTALTVKENDASVATDAFKASFPLGRLPALQSGDGVNLNDSNAAAAYVANETLRGSNVKDAAMIQQWMNFAENEIVPSMSTWVFPCLGIMQYNKQNTDKAKDEVKGILAVLDNYLKTRTFLVGERVTLADIAVATHMLLLYKLVLEPSFRAPYKNANRWFMTVANQPQFKAVVDVAMCEKMAQFDSKKYQETAGKKDGGKKSAKKESAPKKETPKKEAPPKVEEPEKPAEPKDPFALLPAGTLVMDEWKKMIQNNDFDTVALPWLLENFDSENYSVWSCDYLDREDLSFLWMVGNLTRGMFQRLDKMRKYAFGVLGVFGEDNAASIKGLWIWRGQDLAFKASIDLAVDYESYKWTKHDFKAPETQALIKQYFGMKHSAEMKHYESEKFL